MQPDVELDWSYLADLAGRVARQIAEKWCVVETDDVKQEILLHALQERRHIEAAYGDESLLRKIFWTAGVRYAAKERAHYDLMDDVYFYTPDEARAALRSFLYTDTELGEMLGKRDDLLRCKVSDNLVSARIDATAGLKKLTPRYRDLAMRVYVYGLPPKDDAERKAANRAVDALTQAMNRHIRTKKIEEPRD
ncbi:hypothetical protein [Streptomyces sp. ISL-11]|uniref:hypothetical protein n=1 Tax=Streptomyces sp. ISL-11 TaxID=2819174 RepID=UPI001BEC05F1|nr:hypothetical protein [Streptomyces sp. ISL-11]MBT2383893.1 hypothetical protein [Streptomyces sp. ISL-11]